MSAGFERELRQKIEAARSSVVWGDAEGAIKILDAILSPHYATSFRAAAGAAPTTPRAALEALDDLVTEATSQPPVQLEVVREAAAIIRAALTPAGAPRAVTADDVKAAVAIYERWDEGDMWLSRCLEAILADFASRASRPPDDAPAAHA